MGGLISLYACFCRPEVFGFAGVMSPSLWFAQGAIFSYVQQADVQPGRIHLDIGTHEGSDTRSVAGAISTYTSRYLAQAHRMRDLLDRKGYRLGQELQYQEEEEAIHNEAAWARRLPGALRFLLARYQRPAEPLGIAHQPGSVEPWWEF
jgi:predicted alpha/beta superfamily hydrolase